MWRLTGRTIRAKGEGMKPRKKKIRAVVSARVVKKIKRPRTR